MTTEVQDAEREVEITKQRLQQSLQLAGETGSRLAAELRRKATPALMVAVVTGGALLVGATFLVVRGKPRRRASNQPSAAGIVARAVGVWLLRAAALRVAGALAAKFRESTPPTVTGQSELP